LGKKNKRWKIQNSHVKENCFYGDKPGWEKLANDNKTVETLILLLFMILVQLLEVTLKIFRKIARKLLDLYKLQIIRKLKLLELEQQNLEIWN
jgi:hypothetical protein